MKYIFRVIFTLAFLGALAWTAAFLDTARGMVLHLPQSPFLDLPTSKGVVALCLLAGPTLLVVFYFARFGIDRLWHGRYLVPVSKPGKGASFDITDPDVIALLKRPRREPCFYCHRDHLDYACDEQIKFLANPTLVFDVLQLENKPPLMYRGQRITEYEISKPDDLRDGARYIYFLVEQPDTHWRVKTAFTGTAARKFIHEVPLGHPNFPLFLAPF